MVEFGRTSCFCRGLWEKPKLELSNYHRKVNFASFLVADCVLAGQAVIFLTGLSEVFISILATSVRYQGFTLLSSLSRIGTFLLVERPGLLLGGGGRLHGQALVGGQGKASSSKLFKIENFPKLQLFKIIQNCN